jgi:hypothetical protein
VSYDPEELRRVAGAPPHDGDCWDNEWVIAQLRAHADLIERFIKLKARAEKMAEELDNFIDAEHCRPLNEYKAWKEAQR